MSTVALTDDEDEDFVRAFQAEAPGLPVQCLLWTCCSTGSLSGKTRWVLQSGHRGSESQATRALRQLPQGVHLADRWEAMVTSPAWTEVHLPRTLPGSSPLSVSQQGRSERRERRPCCARGMNHQSPTAHGMKTESQCQRLAVRSEHRQEEVTWQTGSHRTHLLPGRM
ncbi:hypothetical protein AAFF_G00206290 [Aldrovandia affinis]|uniref:Uncharacterized protein n=1 Tax=Aldrovandia affinis TaxID=143900 RepID=A0AAD7RHK6_9TELE|nr:hypothetical protein AAFF_G00206290 [Aldrovandia affinis]